MQKLIKRFVILCLAPMLALAQVPTPPNPETGAVNFGTAAASKVPVILQQTGLPLAVPPSGFMTATGGIVIGQAPSNSATVSFSATSGAGVTMTFSAATLLGTTAEVGRVLTILDTTYKYATITTQVIDSNNAGPMPGTIALDVDSAHQGPVMHHIILPDNITEGGEEDSGFAIYNQDGYVAKCHIARRFRKTNKTNPRRQLFP